MHGGSNRDEQSREPTNKKRVPTALLSKPYGKQKLHPHESNSNGFGLDSSETGGARRRGRRQATEFQQPSSCLEVVNKAESVHIGTIAFPFLKSLSKLSPNLTLVYPMKCAEEPSALLQ